MTPGAFAVFVFVALAIFAFYIVARTAVVVPQQHAYVVERLGRFSGVLHAGFHILIPFIDVIRYRHILKEQAIDIPEQYIEQFGQLAKSSSSLVIPTNLADVGSMIATAMSVIRPRGGTPGAASSPGSVPPPPRR